MKRFLKRRWHSIPVALLSALLAIVLITGGVFAAYTFTGMGVSVDVDEPLAVQYNLKWLVHDTESPGGRVDSSGWLDAVGLETTIEAFFSAGDEVALYLRMNNRANSTLKVSTLVSGNAGKFTCTGLPQDQVIPVSNGYDFYSGTVSDADAADWASEAISIKVNGDTAPDVYTLNFEFTRE